MNFHENHEIFTKIAEISETRNFRRKSRKWQNMGENDKNHQNGPQKDVDTFGIARNVYIRFVQFPVIHGLVSEIMKIHELS